MPTSKGEDGHQRVIKYGRERRRMERRRQFWDELLHDALVSLVVCLAAISAGLGCWLLSELIRLTRPH